MNRAHSPLLAETLDRARLAYRRRDDEEFSALLREAIRIAPSRRDLRACLANEFVQTGRTGEALEVFEETASLFPRDPTALLRLAHWRRFAGNEGGAWEAHRRLGEVRPELAADLWRVWTVVDSWSNRPVGDRPPEAQAGPAAVVVLGLKLAPDGSPRPDLVDRLEKTLEILETLRDALVIVTGGVPQSGVVEAVVMRDWLVRRGVPPERVREEGYARDVVENIVFSGNILTMENIPRAFAVTDARNVRRAGAAMDIVSWTTGGAWSTLGAAASGGSLASFVDDGGDRLKLYRDALRAYGLPSMAAYPELAER